MKCFFYFLIGLIFLLSSCQQEDDISFMKESLSEAAANNASAQKLLRLLEQQDGSIERLDRCLNEKHALFQYTTIGATTDFGVYYQIPYTNASGEVTGFIVYPVDEQKQDLTSRKTDGILGNPVSVDGNYLNNDIPITHRLLYASPLIEMKKRSIHVDSSLTSFAERISVCPQKLSSSDNIPQEDKQILTRTYIPGTAEGYVTIDYIMGTYWGTNFTDDEVTAYGFDINTFMTIVEKAFNHIGYWRVKNISHFYYQKLVVVFNIMNADQVYANWHAFMDTVIREVKDEVFKKQFTVSMQYLISLPDKSQIDTPPSSGGGGAGSSGGNYTGGSSSGSSSDNDDLTQDTLRFVNDSLCPNKEYIDSVKAVFELLGKTIGTIGYGTKKYEEYLKVVKGADIEYSTSLHNYDGEYAIDSIVKGEQYKVENITGKYSVSNIHNHPNNTPPSFRDILFTAKCAKDATLGMYKATFVYNDKDDSYYALYITDKNKAANFYDKYCNDLDENTNGIKRGKSLAKLVRNEGQDYASNTKMLFYFNSLILSNNSGMGLFKVKDGKITSYNATKIFDRNKFTYKYSFYKL